MSDFTPLPDAIIAEHGIHAAAVYGRVWRYCQMSKGRCFASAARIARDLNLGQRTVERYLSLMVDSGFLERISGKAEGKPSTYATTPKWVMGMGSAREAEGSAAAAEGVRQRGGHKKEGKKEDATQRDKSRRGAWDGFYSVVAADLDGDADAWRKKRAPDEALALYGRLAGLFGRAAHDDLDRACDLWRRYAESKGDFLPRNEATLKRSVGAWLKDNPVAAGVVSVGSVW